MVAAAPSESATPTEPATPSATPATGRRIDLEQLSFVLPRSFTDMGGYGNGLVSGQTWASEELGCIVTLGRLVELTEYTLEEAAELALANREPTTREPDRVVGGEPVSMLIDQSTPALTTYEVGEVGPVVDGSLLSLTFDFQRDEPASAELMESILATVEWKG